MGNEVAWCKRKCKEKNLVEIGWVDTKDDMGFDTFTFYQCKICNRVHINKASQLYGR